MSAKEKTYEDLLADRQAHWAKVQAQRRAELDALQEILSKMPDIANAPKKGEPWNDCYLACFYCEKHPMFHVERWVTVNGVRHRAELTCLECQKTVTYDFSEKKWLTSAS